MGSHSHRGFILAVSAPSGTGKTSLCDKLAAEHTFVVRSISVTTRPQRDGEVSGRDYIFVNRQEFEEWNNRGALLEVAEVFGNFYGTPREPVERALNEGKVIVMDIDTVGALRIHEMMPRDTVLVFVLPPSLEELERRLRLRGKNTPEELDKRLREAEREISEAVHYHYQFVNSHFDQAYSELLALVEKERHKRA